MKKNRKMLLTEEQVCDLLDGIDEPEQDDIDTIITRNEHILKHYHFYMFALTGTHS